MDTCMERSYEGVTASMEMLPLRSGEPSFLVTDTGTVNRSGAGERIVKIPSAETDTLEANGAAKAKVALPPLIDPPPTSPRRSNLTESRLALRRKEPAK